MLTLLITLACAAASPAALLAQGQTARSERVDWVKTVDQFGPPDSVAEREAEPPQEDSAHNSEDPAKTSVEGVFTYDLWQWGISSLSGLGPISPIQGRRVVQAHAEEIKRWAPDDLELLVAASIAHQASDFKDRPFGTDALELVWRELVDNNISVGIAQLRQEEVVLWAPYLQGVDLLSPDAAIRIMTAKLSQTNSYILHNHPQVTTTDRLMLLALAQNAASGHTMRSTVDHFFESASADWAQMLSSERADELDWREQLRLVLLHAAWLVEQGWSLPEGLDLDFWSRVAFPEP